MTLCQFMEISSFCSGVVWIAWSSQLLMCGRVNYLQCVVMTDCCGECRCAGVMELHGGVSSGKVPRDGIAGSKLCEVPPCRPHPCRRVVPGGGPQPPVRGACFPEPLPQDALHT